MLSIDTKLYVSQTSDNCHYKNHVLYGFLSAGTVKKEFLRAKKNSHFQEST